MNKVKYAIDVLFWNIRNSLHKLSITAKRIQIPLSLEVTHRIDNEGWANEDSYYLVKLRFKKLIDEAKYLIPSVEKARRAFNDPHPSEIRDQLTWAEAKKNGSTQAFLDKKWQARFIQEQQKANKKQMTAKI